MQKLAAILSLLGLLGACGKAAPDTASVKSSAVVLDQAGGVALGDSYAWPSVDDAHHYYVLPTLVSETSKSHVVSSTPAALTFDAHVKVAYPDFAAAQAELAAQDPQGVLDRYVPEFDFGGALQGALTQNADKSWGPLTVRITLSGAALAEAKPLIDLAKIYTHTVTVTTLARPFGGGDAEATPFPLGVLLNFE